MPILSAPVQVMGFFVQDGVFGETLPYRLVQEIRAAMVHRGHYGAIGLVGQIVKGKLSGQQNLAGRQYDIVQSP